jgi:hypothetical protein
MRKRWWLIPLAVVLVVVGFLLPVLFPSPSKVTGANCERIKEGMTRAEVDGILGGPPGDHRTRPPASHPGRGIVMPDGVSLDIWTGDDGEIWVFYESKRVRKADFHEDKSPEAGAIDLGLYRLGRLTDRWFR